MTPEATQLAVGVGIDSPVKGLGMMVAAFEQYDAATKRADLEAAMKRLNSLRAARGVAPAQLAVGPWPVLDDAERRIRGGEHPSTATQRAVEAMGRSGGWMLSIDPKTMVFPDALVDAPSLSLGLQLFHHRVPGSPWGFFVAVAVALDDASAPRSAHREGAAAHL